MGLFGFFKEEWERKDKCCANCRFYNVDRRICKKGMSYRSKQEPHQPCECPQYDKKIW
ncbi:MAG: hypothetical protein IKC48_03785 [Clostridia bacterium]|nr:hypothetical protein [Clostridia bacterium]